MAFFGHFCQKWLFLPFFRKNSPVATGPKPGKKPKIGLFPKKGPKVGVPARGFTSTPRAGAPRFPGSGKRAVLTPAGAGRDSGPPGRSRRALPEPWAARTPAVPGVRELPPPENPAVGARPEGSSMVVAKSDRDTVYSHGFLIFVVTREISDIHLYRKSPGRAARPDRRAPVHPRRWTSRPERGAWTALPAASRTPGNRGAPARGVDVKPLRQEAQKGRKPPKRGFLG